MSKDDMKDEHKFTSSWRWTPSFENWVTSLVSGYSVNVCAGLCPLGDVRVDLTSPLEIIELMQDDENTTLEEARTALSGLLIDEYVGRDVVSDLFHADDPTSHPAAEHIDTSGTVFADVFDETGLPFDDNTFEWTVCDPPWKELPKADRHQLFDELVRITEPDGHILFNAWWIPTNDQTTLDVIRVRQDTERYDMGTPSVSYASVYTVHSSEHIASYLSQTFTTREFTPEPDSLKETIEAETAFRLERVHGVDADAYDIKAVGPDNDHRCPHCGCTRLSPVTRSVLPNAYDAGELYQCDACEFRLNDQELDAIASGHIQRVRFENGFSTVTEGDLTGVNPENPPTDLVNTLTSEPGVNEDNVTDYLRFAVPNAPQAPSTSDNDLSTTVASADGGDPQSTFSD